MRSEGHQVCPNSPCHPYHQPRATHPPYFPRTPFQESGKADRGDPRSMGKGEGAKAPDGPAIQGAGGSFQGEGGLRGTGQARGLPCAGRGAMPRHGVCARHGRACVVFSLWAPRAGGKGWGGQRRQEDEKEQEKQGIRWREERRERREKEKGWERWTNRQTDSPERQAHQPLPTPIQHPRPQLVAPGLSFWQRWAPENQGGWITASGAGTSAQSERQPLCPDPYFRPGVCSRGRAEAGKHGASPGEARPCGTWDSRGGRTLTILPGPRVPGPAPPPPPPRPRLALGVLPQLLLMTCSCRSARSARSSSSSMNCCSRSLALASRAAVSFRNWSICTTSLGPEQSLTPRPRPGCPPAHPLEETLGSRERHGHSCPWCLLTLAQVHAEQVHAEQAQARGPAPRHTQKCKHIPQVTHTPLTQPQRTCQTPYSPRKYPVPLRATSSLWKHSRAYSHMCTQAHVLTSCSLAGIYAV